MRSANVVDTSGAIRNHRHYSRDYREQRPQNAYFPYTFQSRESHAVQCRNIYMRNSNRDNGVNIESKEIQEKYTSRNDQLRALFLKKDIDLSKAESLGTGKYSKVFAVSQLDPEKKEEEKRIAMKIINTRKVTVEFNAKFLPREIDCWRRLNHPHLVRLLGHYSAFHYVFLTMEYGEKGDMLRYVQKNGAVPEKQCRTWMLQIISAVSYIHQNKMAHRDLKLENLVLFSDDTVKVADFGFACPVYSASNTFCGSKSYSAPEVLLGLPYNPYKSDVWSVGIVAFIMISNRMPFCEEQGNLKICEHLKARGYQYPLKLEIRKTVKETIDRILAYEAETRPYITECSSLPWFQEKE